MNILRRINQIFLRKAKIKFILLIFAISFGAALELLALSIISPLISILMKPEMIFEHGIVYQIYNILAFNSVNSFLAFLAISLASVYIFRGLYMYGLNKFQYRLIGHQRVWLSDQILTKIMGKSYIFHANNNIAEMQRIILTDVENFISLITNILLLCSDFFMIIFILLFLFILSFEMTIFVLGISVLCLIVYLKIFRKQTNKAGAQAREKYVGMTKAINQALGGIKEVKMSHREKYFQELFKKNSDHYIVAYQKYNELLILPKLFIETFCFAGAFILVGIMLLAGTDIQNMIPQLSVFVLAAFRLLPAVSRIANYATTISYLQPSADAIHRTLFEEEEKFFDIIPEESCTLKSKDIVVSNIKFQYEKTNNPMFESLSLVIPDKKSVAFTGPSGAGKTTLADIILGILSPQKGSVFYEGKSIHHHFADWAMQVGYIPQQIYLLDESVRENIAFGIPKDKIDENKVWDALEKAQLYDFIKAQPLGLDTIIGDRGIRLSGGQRQRIGIARALYHDPSILILDEATSALDIDTEAAVMDAIQKFQGEKTMIIVAHRLSTIEHCDIIYYIENGKINQKRN